VTVPSGGAGRSIAFDRAAEYYDRTRRMSPEAAAATTTMLAAEFDGRGAILEIGVGTGQIALALHASGVPMAGVDISLPMLEKLRQKAGGQSPFPLAGADGTALPFRTDAFGGVVMRHVLHLVPDYERVAEEAIRVTRPGGVVMASAGWHSPMSDEIERLFSEEWGDPRFPGLPPRDIDGLDRTFGGRGAIAREVPSIPSPGVETTRQFIEAVERNQHSWTWRLSDEERRHGTGVLRAWAEGRGLDPDAILDPDLQTDWRAYDLP
jgi:SAM-dependent methyltransferase